MDKNPISMLQEYTVAKGLPFPAYNIVDENDVYKCIVSVGNIVKDGKAGNKKNAKRIAAENILLHLQSSKLTSEGSGDNSKVIANSVGELNEFCSGRGIDYPIYEFHSPLNNNGEFICKCALDDKATNGTGKNKKEAKQGAAKRMLDIVNSGLYSYTTKTPTTASTPAQITQTPSEAKTIIQLFKQLSFGNKQTPITPTGVPSELEKLTSSQFAKLIEKAQDEQSLKVLLATIKVKVNISTFQQHPHVMCIKADCDNYETFTFLQDGPNVADVRVKLMKAVVDVVAVCYLNANIDI